MLATKTLTVNTYYMYIQRKKIRQQIKTKEN